MTEQHLQYVAYNADGPHVGPVADLVEVDDLRCHELRGPEKHLQLLLGVVETREAEVDDLDPVPRFCEAEDVFRLQQKKF